MRTAAQIPGGTKAVNHKCYYVKYPHYPARPREAAQYHTS